MVRSPKTNGVSCREWSGSSCLGFNSKTPTRSQPDALTREKLSTSRHVCRAALACRYLLHPLSCPRIGWEVTLTSVSVVTPKLLMLIMLITPPLSGPTQAPGPPGAQGDAWDSWRRACTGPGYAWGSWTLSGKGFGCAPGRVRVCVLTGSYLSVTSLFGIRTKVARGSVKQLLLASLLVASRFTNSPAIFSAPLPFIGSRVRPTRLRASPRHLLAP
jgi:hypothetical protein